MNQLPVKYVRLTSTLTEALFSIQNKHGVQWLYKLLLKPCLPIRSTYTLEETRVTVSQQPEISLLLRAAQSCAGHVPRQISCINKWEGKQQENERKCSCKRGVSCSRRFPRWCTLICHPKALGDSETADQRHALAQSCTNRERDMPQLYKK